MIAWLLIVTEVAGVVGKRPFTYELPSRYSSAPAPPADKLASYLFHSAKPETVQLSSRSTGLEHLEFVVSQVPKPQPLPEVGLLVTPDPVLDFGYQQLCVPAVLFVRIWTDGENSVFLKEVISSDVQLKLMREDFRMITVRPGKVVSFKVILFPQRLGTVTASLRFETDLGTALYPVAAFITENAFKLQPISLTTPKSVFFANSESAPVQILDVFSMNDHIVVLSDVKYPYVIEANCTEHLFAVSYTGLVSPGMIVLRTNHTNFYLGVTTHQISLFPAAISFGIVNSPSLRHSVLLLISNFDLVPAHILRIVSSSSIVTVKMRENTAAGKCVNTTLAEVRFYPRSEGYYEGWIEVVTNVTDTPIIVPYSGYALYGLVRYNGTELAFHPSDQHPRDISLSISLPRKLQVLSMTPPRPLFTVRNFKSGRLLTSKPRISFTLVPKVPYEYLGVKFVSLETEAGVVALPASVEDGGVWCVFADSFDSCLYHNNIDGGTLKFGETYSFSLILMNTGMLEQHILARCTQTGHKFEVAAVEKNVKLLGGASCASAKTLPFPPTARTSLRITLTIGSGKPQATLEIHSFYQIYQFTIQWRSLTYIALYPDIVFLEDTYFGQTHRINVSISHTYEDDLLLTNWVGDMDGLEFETYTTVVPANQHVTIGQMTITRKKPGFENRPRSFAEAQSWGNVMDWVMSEAAEIMSASKRITGRLRMTFNETKVVETKISLEMKSPKLTEDKVLFGQVGPYESRDRFIKVNNPTDTELRIQVFLPCQDVSYPHFQPFFSPSDPSTPLKAIFDHSFFKPETLAHPQSSKCSFTFGPESIQVISVPPHKSALIGPVTFSPTLLGSQNRTLQLVSPLSIQTVVLSGELLSPYLYLTPPTDLHSSQQSSVCDPVTKSVVLTNIGNMPVIVTDVSLERSLCEFHGVTISPCHSAFFLLPKSTFTVTFIIDATFVEPSINLQVVTEEETLSYQIEVETVGEGRTCTKKGWLLVATLEAICVGFVLTGVKDWVKMGRKKARLVRLEKDQSAVLPQTLDKKRTKKHKKKKVPPISLVDLSPQTDLQDEGTCKKSEKPVTFDDPNASNKSTIVGENMLEVKISDSSSENDDYLDEYKQSGLFSGFSIEDSELSL